MVLHHRRVDRSQLGARLFERDAGREPAEQLGHAVDAAGRHGGGEVVRAGDDVGDELRFGGIGDGRLEHADDGGGARAEPDGLAEDGGVGGERAGPEAVGQDDGALRGGAVVSLVEQTAQDGTETHHLEVRPADDAGADFARVAQSNHGEADGGEVAERGDGFDAGFQVVDLGDGEGRVLDADGLGALADVNEAVLVPVDEGLHEDAAHEGKDGGVGADAEGEGQDDGDRESLGADKGAGGVFDLGGEVSELIHVHVSPTLCRFGGRPLTRRKSTALSGVQFTETRTGTP